MLLANCVNHFYTERFVIMMYNFNVIIRINRLLEDINGKINPMKFFTNNALRFDKPFNKRVYS